MTAPAAYPLLVLSPLGGLVVDVAAHVLFSRRTQGRYPVAAIVAGVTAGLLATLAMSCVAIQAMQSTWKDAIAYAALNSLTYLALSYGYIGYVGLNLTSLRIHIMKLMWRSGGSLSRDTLRGIYNNDDVIRLRLSMLLRDGYLVEHEGRLRTGKPTVLLIATLWDAMRWLVLGRNGPPFPFEPVTAGKPTNHEPH